MQARIDTLGAATLIVAWRTTRRVQGRVVKAGGAVIDELRRYAAQSAGLIGGAEGRPYDPDDEQGDAPFLLVDREELLDTQVVDVLTAGASLPLATRDDLRRILAFYAFVIGDDPGQRIAFIKKGNPIKLADTGMVALFDETLTRVSQPIFAFSPGFDVVVAAENAWTFDQRQFESLFKDTEVVLAKTGEWVKELSTHVPIAEGSKKEFAERLRSNSVLRRKVQSVLRNPHLAQLTLSDLRRKMRAHGLNPEHFIRGGKLLFDRGVEKDLLYLLNEDLFTGDFSGEQYAASRKARRQEKAKGQLV